MSAILQGTTPSLIISIDPNDLDLNAVTEIELTFKQFNCQPIIKHKADCSIDTTENTIEYHFTEDETLSLLPDRALKWQLRFLTVNREIIGTTIGEIQIADLISNEVLK